MAAVSAFLLLPLTPGSDAQQPYSASPEYRSMLEELPRPAPSPLYIATGRLPAIDPALRPLVKASAATLTLTTGGSIFTLDKASGLLTWRNRRAGAGRADAAWTIATGETGCTIAEPAQASESETSAAGAPPRPAEPAGGATVPPVAPLVNPAVRVVSVTGSSPTGTATSRTGLHLTAPMSWHIETTGSCGTTVLTLDLLTDSLSRLTIEAATAAAGDATREGTGSDPGARLHIVSDRPIFGLGERFPQAALTHTDMDVRPADRYGEPGHNWSYVAVPLVYSTGGLGLFADTAFDVRFRSETPETREKRATRNDAAPAAAFDLTVARRPVPIYLFAEPDPEAVLTAYTALTGRPQQVPFWTFGPWITALQGPDAVLDTAERLRTAKVPASALWIFDEMDDAANLGWAFWFSSYYGDARAFNDKLHAAGFRVLTYVHPYVRQQLLPYHMPSGAWQKGVSEKLVMTDAAGEPAGPRFEPVPTAQIDFTNPAAVDWWQSMITTAVRDQGFDGWMEDFGEWVRDTDRFAAGDGTTMSELYPLLYHKVTTEIAQTLNPGVVSFSRSGAPGTQKFSPVLWGGDQSPDWSRDYGLPAVVTAGITAGMSGYANWGPDILSTGTDMELWTRWVEFGALTPVMRDHPWQKPEHSINVFSSPEATALFRRYAVLHSTLLPYFAAYSAEAHRTGVPMLRHTALEYPDDPRAATAEYQYLLGRELLVAPVIVPGATERTLYLPAGKWLDYWTGAAYTGGREVTVAAPVDRIPMLVKAGSILPFLPEDAVAGLDWEDPHLLDGPLLWKAYPSPTGSADSRFVLPNGRSARLVQTGDVVTITGRAAEAGTEPERACEVVTVTETEPRSVTLNDAPVPVAAPPDQPGRSYDASAHRLHVRFRAATFTLVVSGVTIAAAAGSGHANATPRF